MFFARAVSLGWWEAQVLPPIYPSDQELDVSKSKSTRKLQLLSVWHQRVIRVLLVTRRRPSDKLYREDELLL